MFTNRIELSEKHTNLAKFTDCGKLVLSPQMILGVEDTAEAKLIRINHFIEEGWRVSRSN